MKLNFAMWRKALNIIPEVSKEEWDKLDLISRWLISTRAAVLIMTFLSAALAGIFAILDHSFHFLPWLALTFGLIMAHASNNIFNDYTDFVRGVDKDNYFRTIYGAQPIASGLMTKRQHLTYFAGNGPACPSCRNLSDCHQWLGSDHLDFCLASVLSLFYSIPGR